MEKDLAFYNEHHKNKINKLIHIFCIPSIVWSSFLFTHKYKLANIRISAIVFFLYLQKYYHYSKLIAFRSGLFYSILYLTSYKYYVTYPKHRLSTFYKLFTFSWLLQFYGHARFEKKSPAL